ncbi:MAG TPA: hypothetical protein VGO43_01550 [Pyrinomonadaceae bacterium]|jgi:hypothetical protein|nr:hypothetical protein [Pyrinomonadaceae bacterium]
MTLERDFLKFTPGPSLNDRDRLRVTIGSDGQIYLNRKTHSALGKPEAVHLYYNPTRQVIAVEPAHPRLADTFPVKKRDHGGAAIAAQRMCRHHRIVITASEAFTRPEINNEGFLLLDLRETTRVGGWVRSVDGKTVEERAAEREAARKVREEEREQLLLARAQAQEARSREREKQKLRREIDKKNAAELAKREREIERARQDWARRDPVAAAKARAEAAKPQPATSPPGKLHLF